NVRAFSNVGAKRFLRVSPNGRNRWSRHRRVASVARAVCVRQRRSHNAYTWSMTARRAGNWGKPRLTRHRGWRAVVFRCRGTNRYRWVNTAAPCAASRFVVRAAAFAAGVLGRSLGSLGGWAARPVRALATAPKMALFTAATI